MLALPDESGSPLRRVSAGREHRGPASPRPQAAARGPVWYQLYLVGGREAAEDGLRRARSAGFSALAVTIDTAVPGMRERDFRNGLKELLGASVLAKIPFLPQLLARPGWLSR